MARIAGVDLPRNKRIEISLTYIFGVGRKTALDICAKTGIDPGSKTELLSEAETIKIREVLERDYKVEGDLRREVNQNIKMHGHRLLPRSATSTRPAGSRSADPYERANAQGSGQDNRRQEDRQEVKSGPGRESASKHALIQSLTPSSPLGVRTLGRERTWLLRRRRRRSRRISSRVLLTSNRPSTTQSSRSRMSAETRFLGPAADSRALRDRKSRRPSLRRLQLKRRPRKLWSTAFVRWAST